MGIKADFIVVVGIFGLGFTLGAWLFLFNIAPKMAVLSDRMDKQQVVMNEQVDTINQWLKAFAPEKIDKKGN